MSTSRVNLDITQYVRVTSEPFTPSSLLLQSHRDTVRIAVSDVKPARDNTVFHELGGDNEPLHIPMTETAVWALSMTDRCALTATEQRQPVGIEGGLILNETKALSRVDANILKSSMWAGSTERTNIGTGETSFQVIRTGSIWTVIEDININIDFANAGAGTFSYNLSAYVEDSNGNDFNYDQDTGIVTPMGRNLNLSDINVFPESVIESNPNNSSYSGTPDFQIRFIEYFLEIQGNQSSISETGSNFFEGDRRLLIPPNTDVLLLATTTGDATGTVDIRSNFFISEALNEGDR